MNIFGKIYDLGLLFIDLRYDAMDCALVEENYDKCIQRESCKRMKNSSLSPFCSPENVTNRAEEEHGDNDGEATFKEYKKHFFSSTVRREKCELPCSFATPSLKHHDIKKNKGDYLHKGKVWEGSAILTINFPEKITLMKSIIAYSSINLVSELGG